MTTAVATRWCERTFVGFDLETTGTDPRADRIVTASLVFVGEDGQRTEEDRNWLVNPGIDIPESASDIHHITTETAVRDGMPAAQAVVSITNTVIEVFRRGLPIVVFNANYDLTMLNVEAERHGVNSFVNDPSWPGSVVIDPIVIDRALDKYRKGKRTLTAMSEHYGVSLEDAHTSDADSLATCHIARNQVRRYDKLAKMTPEEIMSEQKRWRDQWAEGFETWLRGRGESDAHIERGWPLLDPAE